MAIPRLNERLELPALGQLRTLRDDELMALQGRLAQERRRVDASSAAVAGELARRSARDLGYRGLAQSLGDRTPENLVARLAGVSVSEARAMVTVGEALGAGGLGADGLEGDAAGAAEAPVAPWLEAVTAGVTAGEVGVGAAAAIRTGLGEPAEGVSADDLGRAAEKLVREVGALPPEKAARRTREVRDELDAARVLDRELALREKRFLRLIPQDDGMTRITGLLDPESAALVSDAIDRVTAPRRGGVRFVDPRERARAERIVADRRSIPQLALDALVQMIRLAATVDEGTIFGIKAPAVRMHVRECDLRAGAGRVHLEGQTAPVSVATAERAGCEVGFLPILLDDRRRVLDLGRRQRLFSATQRTAIAARDGGCLAPGCDRPPSWCEVHHIDEWSRGGRTDVADGVLLCRHHHMWLHDTGRRIERRDADYLLIAPGGDPPHPLRSKHPFADGGGSPHSRRPHEPSDIARAG